ncbi:hypothetical protein [Anaerocolumna aminovalerica]|uniref:hypothetical protein n=1 Tax=Anaerocolumna aminovalerica TaxID=1527 RepID=UPI000BE3E1DD|nr:hypothetical protein [Anaerocolumna aminovalerica]
MKKRWLFIGLFIVITLIVFYFFKPNYFKLDIDERWNDLYITFVEFDIKDGEPTIRYTNYSVEINDVRYDYIKEIVEEQKLYHNIKGVFDKDREEKDISWQIQIYTNMTYLFITSNGNVRFNRYTKDIRENTKHEDVTLYSLGRDKVDRAEAIKRSILEIVQEK